jgi:hypothetical protein
MSIARSYREAIKTSTDLLFSDSMKKTIRFYAFMAIGLWLAISCFGQVNKVMAQDAGTAFDPCASPSYVRLSRLNQLDGLSQAVKDKLKGARAAQQDISQGSGDYVYDEYRTTIDEMPSGTTPEQFLQQLAENLNGTVKNPDFDSRNEFTRRESGPAQVGEIVDIDIMGPDNGSVVLSEQSSSHFIYTVVETAEMGSHPEAGSREFGFEVNSDGSTTFYTRGASRPSGVAGLPGAREIGSDQQRRSWTALMRGIEQSIQNKGGKLRPDSFRDARHPLPNLPNCKQDDQKQGKSYGDPHIATIDGFSYSLQTVGEAILIKSNDGSFEVQERHSAFSSSMSLNTAVAVKAGRDRIVLYTREMPDGNTSTPLRVNGKPVTLQNDKLGLPSGGSIARQGNDYVIHVPSGENVVVSPRGTGDRMFLNISPFVYNRSGKYSGLLGNVNGNPKDDLQIQGGSNISETRSSYGDVKQVLNLVGLRIPGALDAAEKQYFDKMYMEFANSWLVKPEESLFDYPSGKTTKNYTDPAFPDKYLTLNMLSSSQIQQAREACTRANVTEDLMEGCIFDVGFSGFSEFARATAEMSGYISLVNQLVPGANIPTPQQAVNRVIEKVKPRVCLPFVGCL